MLVILGAGQAAWAAQAAPIGPPAGGQGADAGPGAVLPFDTVITLRLNNGLDSKILKPGDRFALSVASDVKLGEVVVIPRGTPAIGEVSYREGKGTLGHAGKIEIDMLSIDLNGQSYPISGHFRNEGHSGRTAAIATTAAVGVVALFVTGHSAGFQAGSEFRVITTAAIPVPRPSVAAAPKN